MPAGRHRRPRSHPPCRLQYAQPAACRLRRRGDQDRSAGQGRPLARLARGGHQRLLEGVCAQQEERHAQLARGRRQGRCCCGPPSAPTDADRELSPGHARDSWASGPEALARASMRGIVVRAHFWLGAGLARRILARFLHPGRGHVGLRREERLRGPRAGAAAAWALADIDRRAVRVVRRDDRAAVSRCGRQRPGD